MVLMLDLLPHLAKFTNHVLVELAFKDFISGRERDLHVAVVKGIDLMELLVGSIYIFHVNHCFRQHARVP
jgi:hypothetical protein